TTQGERFEFDIETVQIEVENGILSGLDGQLKTSFSGQFGLNTLLSGKVTLKQLNFKEWAKHLSLPLPEFVNQQALSEGNGQFEWFWDGSQLLLNDIDVKVDDSTIQGDLSYNFEGTHALRFELSLYALNLDFYQAYLPSEKGEKNIEPKKMYTPIPISEGFLTKANVLGGLNITQLTALNVKVDSLEVDVLAEQGMVQLAPLDATLYQGELLSRLHIDLAGEPPSFHWKGRINRLALEPLAKLQSQPLLLGGSLVSRFDLTSTGAQLETLKSNLSGRFSLTVENAKLTGMDLNKVLAGELDLNPTPSNASYTELQKVTLVGRWSDGIYSARKLDVMSERFSASGAGTFDLSTAKIDTTFNVLVKQQPKGGLDILKGLNFPLSYRGIVDANTNNVAERARWQLDIARITNRSEIQKMLIQSFLNTLKN
ncbi:MAG: AsmA family protein, partial [Thiomicrorhabdus sp.]|nr:AsmA family protein [Thiomicrorhabdus sp.]